MRVIGDRIFKNKPQPRKTSVGYLFMAPTIIILGVFVLLPILIAFVLAFYKIQILGEFNYRFNGFKNFARLLNDDRVWIALRNTVEYVAIVVPIQTIIALGLALILNANLKGKNWFRIIFFMPTVTSSAVLTIIFLWMYNSNGLINSVLAFLGLPTYNWIGDPNVALKAITIMNIWSTAPLFMVIYLAALQDIPESLYEAAAIDGASWWDKLVYITLPSLKSVTFFVVVMGIVGTFQLFDQSYIFSRGTGGPDNSTLTVVLLIYQYAFKSLDMGYAAAIALILALAIAITTLMQRYFFSEKAN
ncbi:carbohydrate ABC transporter permease [Chroococcidiopsis sp. CCALA 051]|uniref:carbohydrate ABC transporter permease n=1 Tax=Chroococcidiopsis sp. CCALA 051 TaxID=869949 RepID=UPI001E521488|nr:sugar ABC transporter permease [Chroococcidiopsis sp. CCALA 051]